MFKFLFSFLLSFFITFGLMAQTQFQNPGFEDWEEVGTPYEEPVNWSSLKTSDTLSNVSPVVMEISDDAHSGNHSVYLYNFEIFGIVATGTITNGRIHADYNPDLGYVFADIDDEQWHTSFTGRPDSVVGWYKANVQEGDNPAIRVVLHTGYQQLPGDMSNVVAEAMLNLPGETVTEWTRFSVPFVYEKDIQPEYLLSILYSGNGTEAIGGSEAWFDDVEMVYTTGIDEISAVDFHVFYANGKLNVKLHESTPEIYQLQIFNLLGKLVFSQQIESGINNSIPLSLPSGMYIVSVNESGKAISKKVFVQ